MIKWLKQKWLSWQYARAHKRFTKRVADLNKRIDQLKEPQQ